MSCPFHILCNLELFFPNHEHVCNHFGPIVHQRALCTSACVGPADLLLCKHIGGFCRGLEICLGTSFPARIERKELVKILRRTSGWSKRRIRKTKIVLPKTDPSMSGLFCWPFSPQNVPVCWGLSSASLSISCSVYILSTLTPPWSGQR